MVHVITEAFDHYYYVYSSKPETEDVIRRVWDLEGHCEDLDFYLDTTSVKFRQCPIEDTATTLGSG